MGGYFPKVKIILLLEHSSYGALGCWGIEHAGVWRELREMTEDYEDSYLHERIRAVGLARNRAKPQVNHCHPGAVMIKLWGF